MQIKIGGVMQKNVKNIEKETNLQIEIEQKNAFAFLASPPPPRELGSWM